MNPKAKSNVRCAQKTSPAARRPTATSRQRPHSVSHRSIAGDQATLGFAREEHLRVQRKIEERAHQMWLAQGCAPQRTLADWLEAENEVLAKFVTSLAACIAGGAGPGKAQNSQVISAFLPELPHSQPSKWKQPSTAAMQYRL